MRTGSKCECGGKFIKFSTHIIHKWKRTLITYECNKCLKIKEELKLK